MKNTRRHTGIHNFLMTAAGFLAIALGLSYADSALAEETSCDVLTIRASNASSGVIAAELGAYSATLAKPPFSAFNRFDLIAKNTYVLGPSHPETQLKLPSPMTGSLAYKAFTGAQFHLDLKMSKTEGTALSTTIKASPGKPFFVAGFSLPDGGTLLVGFICTKR